MEIVRDGVRPKDNWQKWVIGKDLGGGKICVVDKRSKGPFANKLTSVIHHSLEVRMCINDVLLLMSCWEGVRVPI